MSTTNEVVLYGASGYTGRLVAEFLREYSISFTAAGRDKARIEQSLATVPGIDTADYDIAEAPMEKAALTELFKGAKVVCNVTGPFVDYGDIVAEAALDAGAHYIDTTGEQPWVIRCQEHWGPLFAEKNLVCVPSMSYMYATSEIAAQYVLETPGIDTLDVLVLFKGIPTYASTQSFFSVLQHDAFYLQQGKYEKWQPGTSFEVPIPSEVMTALALPWGGMSHPVWFKDDHRVSNVRAIGGNHSRELMNMVLAATEDFEQNIRPLPQDEQKTILLSKADAMQSGMPPRENRRIHRTIDLVRGRGNLSQKSVLLNGTGAYLQTGLLQAVGAFHLLHNAPFKTGFASPCQAFGHNELFGALESYGLIKMEENI
ncbi:DUF5938 domain-containing protein [Aliiglaciecola sp. M165]|uniref:DUF5938 domain-containing protein n=1 Tax=Aliiglaciecola sp. M165 TaxID=2593649 RepID=UPI00117D1554|nr:DUF5938 domain-containing protein [Aliiglaciecola sp. M165]TRY33068.1 saccharopine dehydrogenase [Aliiglaciecola sp. M165]